MKKILLIIAFVALIPLHNTSASTVYSSGHTGENMVFAPSGHPVQGEAQGYYSCTSLSCNSFPLQTSFYSIATTTDRIRVKRVSGNTCANIFSNYAYFGDISGSGRVGSSYVRYYEDHAPYCDLVLNTPVTSGDIGVVFASYIGIVLDGSTSNPGAMYDGWNNFVHSGGPAFQLCNGVCDNDFPGNLNVTPDHFWSEISNDSGAMVIHTEPNTTSNSTKQLPSGWAIQVIGTKKDGNNAETVEGSSTYRWYQVQDATDGTTGWMKAGVIDNATGNFVEGQEYLKYDTRDLSATSSVQYTTPTGRASLVLSAVDHYYKDTSTAKNLYSSADKSNISLLKNLGIYQGQPMGSIPIGVILGFFAQEDSSLVTKNGPLTDKSFNNENISYDYGSGVGQITLKPSAYDHKGEYSDIKVFPCSLENNNYIGCYAKNNPSNIYSSQRYVANPIDGNTYKFYTNTIQSIYSNVKDGLGVLSKAYGVYKTAFNENTAWTGVYKNKTPGVGGWPGNCPIINGDNSTVGINLAEMRKIVAIKGYNGTPHPRFGFVFDDGSVPEKQDCYLSLVADKVIHLNQYFPSYSIQQEELDLAKKMQVVDQNKTRIDIHSPGTLRIVDGSGAVTELLADSSISAGLPNVAYSEDGKSAEVYFPDSSYKYQVVGDKAGTYGLSIANTTPDATSTVELYNVPLAVGEVYTYQVDWNALAQGENGVTIQIDKNGDGVTDDTIQAGAVVSDAIAPVTTSSISSTPGTNNWYTSDATVSLTAIDNDGGVGVEKTTYSLDGGDWQTYATTTPVVISADGVHSLQYYSVDYFGNIEATSTLDFKIDATAPTIFASDTSAEQLTLDGTQLTISVTVNDGVDTNPIFTTDVPLTQTFAPGVTNILITAHDMAGNIATSSIAVTVYSSPEADPDGDGVPNQDDVKPFDATVFANLTIPDEYSLWEKESFDLPFSVAGKGNVTLSLSNTYYRVVASPVKDSSGGIIPATVVTLDGVINVSFPQGAKDLKTYTLTLTTTKGNTKERKSLKEKRDHESDEGRRHDLDKELDFASAPITLSITNTWANKTTSQAGTVAIYDKQQTVQLQYKYKETNRSTSLLLKSDDVLKIKK